MTVAKITAAEARRVASFRAGLILDSVLGDGWWPEELEREYGADGVEKIAGEISKISRGLVEKGGRSGAQ